MRLLGGAMAVEQVMVQTEISNLNSKILRSNPIVGLALSLLALAGCAPARPIYTASVHVERPADAPLVDYRRPVRVARVRIDTPEGDTPLDRTAEAFARRFAELCYRIEDTPFPAPPPTPVFHVVEIAGRGVDLGPPLIETLVMQATLERAEHDADGRRAVALARVVIGWQRPGESDVAEGAPQRAAVVEAIVWPQTDSTLDDDPEAAGRALAEAVYGFVIKNGGQGGS